MALIVEDGSNVPGANSFVSLIEIKDYASLRGYELPASDPEIEQLSFRVMDFIVMNEPRYQGVRTYADQSLPFPRRGMIINNQIFPDNEIPELVRTLQCQLIAETAKGTDLFPTVTGPGIKRKKVGPLETEWFDDGMGGAGYPFMPLVDALLSPLFGPYYGGIGNIKLQRI